MENWSDHPQKISKGQIIATVEPHLTNFSSPIFQPPILSVSSVSN